MDFLSLALVVVPLGIMAYFANSANQTYQSHDRLPMQWTMSGEVSWSAPRAIALFFMPIMAAVLLIFMAWISSAATPGARWLMLAITAVAFLAAQFLHLKLMRARVS